MNDIESFLAQFEGKTTFKEPKRIKFDIDSELEVQMAVAVEENKSRCTSLNYIVESFDVMGKQLLKKHNLHPEAFVQASFGLEPCASHSDCDCPGGDSSGLHAFAWKTWFDVHFRHHSKVLPRTNGNMSFVHHGERRLRNRTAADAKQQFKGDRLKRQCPEHLPQSAVFRRWI